MTDDLILAQQLAYYRARALEYNVSVAAAPQATAAAEAAESQRLRNALLALGPVQHALDLACGTGLWTRHLLTISDHVTALHGAPEMLALHQQRFGDARITYHCADLFTWEPAQQYELVCCAFWLSHVPPDRLDAFCATVARAVCPGGHVFIVDQPATAPDPLRQESTGIYQVRTLADGRQFTIVKVYYDPVQVAATLQRVGFTATHLALGQYYFGVSAQRCPEV